MLGLLDVELFLILFSFGPKILAQNRRVGEPIQGFAIVLGVIAFSLVQLISIQVSSLDVIDVISVSGISALYESFVCALHWFLVFCSSNTVSGLSKLFIHIIVRAIGFIFPVLLEPKILSTSLTRCNAFIVVPLTWLMDHFTLKKDGLKQCCIYDVSKSLLDLPCSAFA